ncbi:MAG: hypothetical protein RL329_195 [Bacteroidota bacterium]|jgi:hypothetical protein
MDNLTLKSAVVVAALAALPATVEAQVTEIKAVTPAAQVGKSATAVSKAAKSQLQNKANLDKGTYVRDGWFKVNKPADKLTPVEKINVRQAASKVKG